MRDQGHPPKTCHRCDSAATVECRLCDRDLCDACADFDADLDADRLVGLVHCDGGCRPEVVAVTCRRCDGQGVLDPAAPGCAPRGCPDCAGHGEVAWQLMRGDDLLGTLYPPGFERACAEALARKIERLDDAEAEAAIEHCAEHGTLPRQAAM